MVVEQNYPLNGFCSPQFRLVVTKIGIRTISAECSGADINSLPPVNVSVIASFQFADQPYTFESVVRKYIHFADRVVFLLQRPMRVTKVQRRFSYRVPVETRTTYRFHWPGPSFDDPLYAKIVNLSEGGVLITTNAPLYEGAMVTISVPSGKDGDSIDVAAEVLEVTEDLTLRQESKVGRLRFDGSDKVHLTDEQRRGIVTYLFEQQRLMLQTRRLLNPAKKKA